MTDQRLYGGREQTLVKHLVLRKYLERFAHIVCARGSPWDTLVYVDCFSGPWNVKSDDFRDSSFAIALDELRKARDTWGKQGKQVKIRCFFLEKVPSAFKNLQTFASQVKDADVVVRNSEFENSIEEILHFVKSSGQKAFPFFFIDPTGWTGFAMKTIAPLLRCEPCEVLINLMGHIHRFLESPQAGTQESFIDLFGSLNFREKIQGLTGQDKIDAAVEAYEHGIRNAGNFAHALAAVVLHPEKEKTHFHLVYATRNPKGVEVFKEAEKKAMEVQEKTRAELHLRRREEETGNMDLFGLTVPPESPYYDGLRERYPAKAKAMVLERLRAKVKVHYDEVWALVVSQPLTWESDLKGWIKAWQRSGNLKLDGMRDKQKVPKRGAGNFLLWSEKACLPEPNLFEDEA